MLILFLAILFCWKIVYFYFLNISEPLRQVLRHLSQRWTKKKLSNKDRKKEKKIFFPDQDLNPGVLGDSQVS